MDYSRWWQEEFSAQEGRERRQKAQGEVRLVSVDEGHPLSLFSNGAVHAGGIVPFQALRVARRTGEITRWGASSSVRSGLLAHRHVHDDWTSRSTKMG